MKIDEKLGIPTGIEKEADRVYRLIKKSLKNAEYPDKFEGDDDEVILLTETNIKIKELNVPIGILLFLKYYEPLEFPEIISLGCGSKPNINLNNKNKLFIRQKSNVFYVNVAVGDKIDKDDIIKAIDKDMKRSSIAHELMHFYDSHKKETTSVSGLATYASYQLGGFPPIISKFLHLLYYMTSVESIVRPTELYKDLLDNKITKENFEDFMESSKMIKMIKSAKNFSLDRYREKLNNDPLVKDILKDANSDGYELSDDPSYDILQLLFLNLTQKYGDSAKEFINLYINENRFKVIFAMFGSRNDDSSKIFDIANDNFKDILNKMTKYQENPIKYFEYLEKMLNFEGNKMYKKLYKLYDMVENKKSTKKGSIINWDLHNKINSKTEKIIYKFDQFKNKFK
jgi:hypothetical protein